MKSIRGQRILLRELKETDWPEIHDYASRAEVSKFQAWGPNSEAETIDFVHKAMDDAKRNPQSRFLFVIETLKDHTLIGAAEINVRDACNQSGEIGYLINPKFWGKGFATEAARLLIGYGFKQLSFHRIYATCHPENAASTKVLEKAGMTKEGTLRDHLKMNDGWRDSHLYSILEHEWDR
jgi:[ribosomal protein S5]-alanine N-acetyltransferase